MPTSTAHRSRTTPHPAATPHPASNRRLPRWLAGLITIMMVCASCGFDAQTLQPYTPANGVNFDVGAGRQVLVRELLIISAEPGEGIVSATVYAQRPDTLLAVTGSADALDGDGVPLTGTLTVPIPIPADGFVKLSEQPPIIVRSEGLRAGLTARLTLRFQDAGEATISVPVMDDDIPYYATIEPLAP